MPSLVPSKSCVSAWLKTVDRLEDRHDVVAAAERAGAVLGVLQRILRRVAVGHHHGAQPLLAERIDGECGADRRIDAARQAEHDVLEAVLVDVVAQAEHAGAIVGLFLLGDLRHRPVDADPAGIAALPLGDDERLLELAHLEGQRLVGA